MSCCVTIDDVKAICPSDLPDNIIQLYIDSVCTKIGACLSASYDESTAKLINMNMVAYLVCGQSGYGQVKSERAPNGASTTYEVTVSKDGLQSSSYGRTVYNLDTNGCWQGMMASTVLIGCVGNGAPPVIL